MVKVLLLTAIAAALTLQQCEALKCHFCLDACEVSKSQDMLCGQGIGDSYETICTTEVPKDSRTPHIAVRRCQIIAKGGQHQCPANFACTTCKSDLCNSAPATFSRMTLVGIATTIFVFLLN